LAREAKKDEQARRAKRAKKALVANPKPSATVPLDIAPEATKKKRSSAGQNALAASERKERTQELLAAQQEMLSMVLEKAAMQKAQSLSDVITKQNEGKLNAIKEKNNFEREGLCSITLLPSYALVSGSSNLCLPFSPARAGVSVSRSEENMRNTLPPDDFDEL
jgi:hypothetical protein